MTTLPGQKSCLPYGSQADISNSHEDRVGIEEKENAHPRKEPNSDLKYAHDKHNSVDHPQTYHVPPTGAKNMNSWDKI